MAARQVPHWRRGCEPKIAYTTDSGMAYRSTIETFLDSTYASHLRGSVNLILTSPPFPLASPKAYGNLQSDEYVTWLTKVITGLKDLLTPDGSLVVEIGNAWNSGSPTMSLAPLQTLMNIASSGDFHLCQQFVCHNPARLPSPASWVTVKRIRVKDSFTHVWWFSQTEYPKADNRNVLTDYSPAMKRLLKRGSYNTNPRPSDHDIGDVSFLKDNGGAIPASVLQYSNTAVSRQYQEWCRSKGIRMHPARMQEDLISFFIKFLTDEGDTVFDPFAGSQTTGAVAESLGRRWVGVEPEVTYLEGSMGRFQRK